MIDWPRVHEHIFQRTVHTYRKVGFVTCMHGLQVSVGLHNSPCAASAILYQKTLESLRFPTDFVICKIDGLIHEVEYENKFRKLTNLKEGEF